MTQPPTSQHVLPAADLTIPYILRVLRARFIAVVAVTAIVIGGTAYLIRETEPTYKATAVVKIADARRALTTGIEELVPAAERLASPLLSDIQLIRSRTLIAEVVDSLGLRLRPRFEGFSAQLLKGVQVDSLAGNDSVHLAFSTASVTMRVRDDSAIAAYGERLAAGGIALVVASQPVVSSTVWEVTSLESAVGDLLDDLRVAPRPQTNVVDITFTANRRLVAQQVATAVAERFQAMSAASARDQSHRRRVFLETQLRQSDSALSAAQVALTDFRRGTAVYSSRAQLEGVQREAMRLDGERETFDAERRTHVDLLASLQEADDARRRDGVRVALASPAITVNPVVMQLATQLLRHRVVYDSLTTGPWRSAQTNPDVQRLRSLIGSTEEQLIAAVRGRVTALDAQIGSIDVARARSAAILRRVPGVEAQEIRLVQLVESIQRGADELRAEYQRARVAEAVEVGPVEIVDRAALPVEPVPQLRSLKLVLGLVLGLGLGGALAFVLEMRTTPIRRREDVEEALQLPSLALIPKIDAGDEGPALSRPARFVRALAGGSSGFGFEPKPSETSTFVGTGGSLSAAREAYRILRTNLLFSQDAAQRRSIAITSAAPGEGKTTIAVNLAIAFAHGGARVALVDADLRRARLHRMFRTPRAPGLAEVTQGTPLSSAVRPTGIQNLFVLPGGDPRAIANAVGETALRALLRELGEEFDLVIIDTPPVLALADASVVAATADTTLFVVHAGRTPRAVAQQALQQLEVVGARVAGTVLNDPAGVLPEYLRYYGAYAPAGS